MLVQSKHKELVGHVNGDPYHVIFDEDGLAEVEESVGQQLLELNAANKAPETAETTDITKMNVKQLQKYAADKGYDLSEATKKPEILAKIQEIESQTSDAPTE